MAHTARPALSNSQEGQRSQTDYLHSYLSQTLAVKRRVLARTPSDELSHVSKGANTVFSPNLGAS